MIDSCKTKSWHGSKQSDTRQWENARRRRPQEPLYQMMKTSVERFGTTNAFGYIPAPGASRVHVTYNEFADLVDAAAVALMDRGVEAGDRIAIILDNSVEVGSTIIRWKCFRGCFRCNVYSPTRIRVVLHFE